MFRNGLLISTAMTAVTLLLSGTPTGASAQTDMHVADRDANARFLCTYGKFDVSYVSSSSEGSEYLYSRRVAVPVVGRGQTVKQIIVMEGINRFGAGFRFSAGIYSNSARGRPGKLIAGGTGSAHYPSSSCQQVTISIPLTTLQPKTKYWIEENAPSGVFTDTRLYWYINPKEKKNAFAKTYLHSCTSSSVCHTNKTHWTRQTGPGPWFNLK